MPGGVLYVYHRCGSRNDWGKVQMSAEKDDIRITHSVEASAMSPNPYQDRVDMAMSLFGVLPQTMTLEQANKELLDQI